MSSPHLKFLFSLIGVNDCFFALFVLNYLQYVGHYQ